MNSAIVLPMSSNLTFNTLVESQQIMPMQDGVGVQGLALPFEKTSRNGFRYITESIKNVFQSMIGQPVLFNHDPDKVLGHVEDISISEEGMAYKMNVDSEGPFGWVANKLKRGDLKKVSIQCLYDEDQSYMDDDGTMNAWVKEFLELSVVTIPGFADTTAQVYEKFKAKGENKMSEEEKSKQEDVVETSEPQEENPAVEEQPKEAEEPKREESTTEAVDDNEDEEEDDKASEEEDRLGKLEKQVASLKAELDDMKKGDDDDSEESDDEEEKDDKAKEATKEPEEDKEAKVEEAIRNDKQSISSEQLQEESKTLSAADLKELYAKHV